ncbi:hypothetical protein [Arthrobacter sp. NA-172]|uniref:hypothetical protein n=1 Tax=Arthrobacter sp. NA-172 TaxID=3367524 RepID=UPI00375471FC
MKAAILEDNTWLEDAEATIDQLSRDMPEFTADDLRKEMREPANTNWPGMAFANARNKGLIESVASSVSHARTRKYGSLKIWTRRIKEEATS